MKPTVIIGAGITGLTTGYALQQAGREVVILEKTHEVGGLARSIDLDGFLFDIGPHYFFLKTDPRADALVLEMLNDEEAVFDFQVSAVIRGRNLAWPPNLKSLVRLPISSTLTSVKNMIRRRFPPDKDCRGFISNFYGKAMYEAFVGPYLKKKIPLFGPDRLHREWWLQAPRAIDNQYPGREKNQLKEMESKKVSFGARLTVFLKLTRGLVRTALGKNLRKVFYPAGGIGAIPKALARRFEEAGGKIVYGVEDLTLRRTDTRIQSVTGGGQTFDEPETVIYTGPIDSLLQNLDLPASQLPFVGITLGFIKMKRPLDLPPYLYTYYAQPEVIFNRAYFPALIRKGLVPAGKDAICVEISPNQTAQGPGLSGEQMEAAILSGLEQTGLCRAGDVESIERLDIPAAYPVYPLDYYERLQELWTPLRAVENLWAIGRSAQFFYNNMARAMSLSFDLAEHLLAKGKVD